MTCNIPSFTQSSYWDYMDINLNFDTNCIMNLNMNGPHLPSCNTLWWWWQTIFSEMLPSHSMQYCPSTTEHYASQQYKIQSNPSQTLSTCSKTIIPTSFIVKTLRVGWKGCLWSKLFRTVTTPNNSSDVTNDWDCLSF